MATSKVAINKIIKIVNKSWSDIQVPAYSATTVQMPTAPSGYTMIGVLPTATGSLVTGMRFADNSNVSFMNISANTVTISPRVMIVYIKSNMIG